MENWKGIGDDEIAAFGDHSWNFSFPDGSYTISVAQTEQDHVSVKYRDTTETWLIQRKMQLGIQFKLSGLADWTPGILQTACWFELAICPNPMIEYWGDRVIFRTDLAM